MIETITMFQSLVGFKINWNTGISAAIFCSIKFQSLVGFKINWNTCRRCWAIAAICWFQSLVGFKINWNHDSYHAMRELSRFNP